MKLDLLPEARDWWRLWSVRLILLAAAVDFGGLLWLVGMLPPPIRDVIPLIVIDAVKVVLFGMAVLARFYPQKKLKRLREERTKREAPDALS